jgi:hypothetical protein
MVTTQLFGYVDPVSGTIILQMIIAGMIGCVGYFRKSIRRLASKCVARRARSGYSSMTNGRASTTQDSEP